jgi:hypothetical protein
MSLTLISKERVIYIYFIYFYFYSLWLAYNIAKSYEYYDVCDGTGTDKEMFI